jgi:DNA-binding response OmpR family regulator
MREAAMKKVLIEHDIYDLLESSNTFLSRMDFTVVVAATNDELLNSHRAERADLIITKLDMPGMPSEKLCSLIRDDAGLREVSIIMVCENTRAAIEQSSRCRANAVLLRPVHPVLLMAKAQQLLDIAERETLRVLLSASVETHAKDDSFYCRTRNVSATGMLIETDQPLNEGDRLTCVFYLPNAKKITASGKIIRTIERAPGDEDYKYGLMFTNLTPQSKKLLTEYVEEISRKPYPPGL